jgi:hypothetical protein
MFLISDDSYKNGTKRREKKPIKLDLQNLPISLLAPISLS